MLCLGVGDSGDFRCDGAHSKIFRLSLTQIEVYTFERLIDSMGAALLTKTLCSIFVCTGEATTAKTKWNIFFVSFIMIFVAVLGSHTVYVVLHSFFSFSFRSATTYNLLIETLPP